MDLDDEVLMWEDDSAFSDFASSSLESYNENQKSETVSLKDEILFKQIDEDFDYAFALSLARQDMDEIDKKADTNSKDDSSFRHFDVASSSLYSYNKNQKSETASLQGEILSTQFNEDRDFALALALAKLDEDEVKENTDTNSKKSVSDTSKESKPLSIVDERWELIDPHPDIHALFIQYDKKFFYGKLTGVEVRWSPRMTLCAGVCSYEGRGGFCSIRLSVPLLKLRPRRDLVETLLHEMIHAYLFVTHNNKDRDGHGPEFLKHMSRINKETGTRITVYHSFHDEVEVYKQHWWKCDGPCQKRRPFYGLVKRAMNRAPGPNDNWWADHQASCGGKFIKIKEPDDYSKKGKTKKHPTVSESKGSHSDIRSFLKDGISASSSSSNYISAAKPSNVCDIKSILSKEENVATVSQTDVPTKRNFIPFQGTGVRLGGSSDSSSSNKHSVHKKRSFPVASGFSTKLSETSQTPKFPRISNNSKSVVTQTVPSDIPTSSNSPKKLIQSPIEKFLNSRIVPGSSTSVKRNINQPNTFEKEYHGVSKVSCPVCHIKCDDINSHLDQCLNN